MYVTTQMAHLAVQSITYAGSEYGPLPRVQVDIYARRVDDENHGLDKGSLMALLFFALRNHNFGRICAHFQATKTTQADNHSDRFHWAKWGRHCALLMSGDRPAPGDQPYVPK
jgi:hypothetical protein